MKVSALLIFALLLLSLAACRQKDEQKTPEPGTGSDAPAADSQLLNTLFNNWNQAHASRDSMAFVQVYDDSVWYYGRRLTAAAATSAKLTALRADTTYRQEVTHPVFATTGDTSTCNYVKTSTVKGVTNSIPASLVFVKRGSGWRLHAESDSATDALVAKTKAIPVPAMAATGDFNGDGVQEYLWMVRPKIDEAEMECDGPCTATIRTNDAFISTISIKDCIGGDPENLGDLDSNGTDEIGFVHEWFTSCWKAYYVYTYKNNKWSLLIPALSVHCILLDENKPLVEKDPRQPGTIIARYSEMTDDGILTKTRRVKVR